ncbi:putative RNA helicase [Helianthus anomalus]
MRALGDHLDVKVQACVGGTCVREDQCILSTGVNVVVGTHGRMFVLDDADKFFQEDSRIRFFSFIFFYCPRMMVLT